MSKRLTRIDELRGLTLISMILYHFMWDLNNIAGLKMDWYYGPIGVTWQKSICITFILLSGFSFNLGKHHFKRSMQVFLAGALVSAVTLIIMPENRIVFGVLTFIGSAGLLMILIDRVHVALEKKLNVLALNLIMLIGSLLLFLAFYNVYDRYINLGFGKIDLPAYLYSGYVSTYIGFTEPQFFSTDYFALIPWMFLYMVGYYLYRVMANVKCDTAAASNVVTACDTVAAIDDSGLKIFKGKEWIRFDGFLGRNSLVIYLLHQPVLYAVTMLIMKMGHRL